MRKTKIFLFLVISPIILTGCISSYPPNNVPFKEIKSLSELNGT